MAQIIVRDLIAAAPPAIAGDPLYFRVTRQGWDYLQSIDANARAELEDMASDKNDDAPAKIIGEAYDGVVGLMEIIPDNKARKVTRFAQRLKGRDVEKFIAAARRAQAYREEQGPLFGILRAEAECELRGGDSALSLQKFVERTTRWMTQEQKAWTMALAFLEDINTDSVRCMLPDSEPEAIVEWFKHESSIRSPEAAKWRMLPLIRSRLQASVQNDSPSQYKTYQERATRANRLVT